MVDSRRGGADTGGVRRALKRFQQRVEPTVVRCLLLAIAVTGLVAQFVRPVGDALEGKTFLGGALLSLVGYLLYDALKELTASARPPERGRVDSRDLGGYVADAFGARHVEVSFFGYTGETLYNELYHRLEQLARNPGVTRRVRVRFIVPDFARPMKMPARVGAGDRPEDDPAFRRRLEEKCREYDEILSNLAVGLTAIGRMDVQCEYRVYQGPPLYKLCIFNRKRVLHGLYDLSARMPLRGPEYYDPKGYDTDLSMFAGENGAEDELAIAQWAKHFDDLWTLVADPPAWRRATAA
ncbi:hypothetical protein [Streptomyces sp. NPDC049813]|uniref:hypothetical protein n=1 Tax=Streptomyces sp. NPDC049813 TaxID=3365597 RepID=UPI00378FA3DF